MLIMVLKSHEHGFALITAIIMLLLLASVSVFLLKLDAMQRGTSLMALQAARAKQVARSGLQWGIYQVINTGGCFASPTTINFDSSQPGLSGFRSVINCAVLQTYSNGLDNHTIYQINAHGQYDAYGGSHYVSRKFESTLEL